MLDASATEFLSIPDLLKATPSEEGGARFVYLEASNEARDFQGEVVLAKALSEGAAYYARYGNGDIDHYSLPSVARRAGIANPQMWEIGLPAEVRPDGTRTFVKMAVYSGDTPLAAKANEFWDSQTRLRPAKRWYPSVGGEVLGRSRGTDPVTGAETTFIKAVRWLNIGFSATPVNPAVPTVSTVPFGALAKSWGAHGLDLGKAEALTAGHGTDGATLEGGGALRRQSLDRKVQSYWDFSERVAAALRKGACGMTAAAIAGHAVRDFGLAPAEAGAWTRRFLDDLRDGITRGSSA